MKFVQLHVLPLVRVWPLLKVAKVSVRRAVPVMRATSSVEIAVFPSQSVVASIKTATTKLAKCFIPVGSVKRSASAHRMDW